MINKEYIKSDKLLLMNFSQRYCKSGSELLNSDCFKEVWSRFIDHAYKASMSGIINVVELSTNPKEDFIVLFQLLLTFSIDEIVKNFPMYEKYLDDRDELFNLVEDFYNYWRRLQRYGIMYAKSNAYDVESVNFIDATQAFNDIVLSTYRGICEKIAGKPFSIYRQLPAGTNASLLLSTQYIDPKGKYGFLNGCSFIESIVIKPPFIAYSAKNKRTGTYQEVFTSPLNRISLNVDDFFCYAAHVGGSLAYVYFHRDFLAHGIALCNLFDFVPRKDCEGRKPDLMYIFGAEMEGDSVFYYDKEEDIYLGIAPHNSSVDYFGYMKKMLLTLYNVKMISQGNLPIHGACVNIRLKNGKTKNVVIVGDSGAGKSESLEALTRTAGEDIASMKTIFDDMGTFKMVGNDVYAYGTEIGAFVRLDDMAADYAYNEMDRAIFMNPNQTNSRLVIPVATYSEIMRGYKVDMVFYANNYDKDTKELTIFDNSLDATKVFIRGARFAKGTTQEIGLVESFFANPFGPVQKQKETTKLINNYFSKLFENKVLVGELHTKLAVPGYERSGPQEAAEKLLELLKEN